MTHHLKCWPSFFRAVVEGRKTYEVRTYDRDFAVGDDVLLYEWDPDQQWFTGRISKSLSISFITIIPSGTIVFGWSPPGGFRLVGVTASPEDAASLYARRGP